MAGAMGKFSYVGDDTNTYRLKLDASNAAAGGLTADSGGLNKPAGLKPRYVLAVHPTTGRQRKVFVNASHALWTGATNTVNLVDFTTTPSASIAYSIQGRVGEKRRFV